MIKSWHDYAWEDYVYWQSQDKKTLKKINKLIEDIERNGEASGTGKPEPLNGCTQVISLALTDCTIKDMERLSERSQVEDLFLDGTNIASAKELLLMKSLHILDLRDTALLENAEEMEKIYEEFPKAEIMIK